MSQFVSVIIDNDALCNLYDLDEKHKIFLFLRSVFSKIHIPLEVKNEFLNYSNSQVLPNRQKFIDNMSTKGFLTICTQFDIISLSFYNTQKGIDKGEAEAVAQHQKIRARFVLSDDSKFTNAILSVNKNITVINTLHILAYIEFSKLYGNIQSLKKDCHTIRPFSSRQLKIAYEEVAKHLRLNRSKKEISNMTSLKQLEINC